MAKLRLVRLPNPFVILIIQCLLLSAVNGQAKDRFVEQPAYSNFQLFKNTGLQPCPINDTATKGRALTPRDPRRGGGGGGSRGGGGSADELIRGTWVGNQENYCKYMKGTPIMIPTIPTQSAFTPWWPAFTTQFVSLLFTWIGLWWTTRGVEKDPGAQDMKLPVTFWIQLPLDIARLLAWFVKTIRGFADASQFGWVSVILWLVPFNYIWLVQLLDPKNKTATPASEQDATQSGHGSQPAPCTYPQQDKLQMQEQGIVPVDAQNTSGNGFLQGKSKFYWISITFGFITALQWIMSFAIVVLHFRYSWFHSKSHPTYVEVPHAINDPSSIAIMPKSCSDWLQNSTNLISSDLLDIHLVQVIQTLILALQLAACTAVILFRRSGPHQVLGKLKLSAAASLATLGLPAIGTGLWILGTVTFGNQDTWMTYTNNITTTGGCTFGAVAMDRQWGYWDVEYERPYRIAMSLLGVS